MLIKGLLKHEMVEKYLSISLDAHRANMISLFFMIEFTETLSELQQLSQAYS